jgi:hypothetical protein
MPQLLLATLPNTLPRTPYPRQALTLDTLVADYMSTMRMNHEWIDSLGLRALAISMGRDILVFHDHKEMERLAEEQGRVVPKGRMRSCTWYPRESGTFAFQDRAGNYYVPEEWQVGVFMCIETQHPLICTMNRNQALVIHTTNYNMLFAPAGGRRILLLLWA